MRRVLPALAANLLVFSLTACTTDTDPTIPCGSVDLGAPDTAVMARSAHVFAFTDTNGEVAVVRDLCPRSTCAGAEIDLLRLGIDDLQIDGALPERLMLSGTGNWLAFLKDGVLRKIDLACDPAEDETCHRATRVWEDQRHTTDLVGSLRSGDWVVLRDGDGLQALDLSDAEEPPLRLGEDDRLLAVALGDRSLVARRILDGDEEELFLIRINPTKHHDMSGYASAGTVQFLGRGRAFSRVIVTRGPTPAELGDTDERDPDVPIDEYVVATSGAGDDATTVVFRVMDGEPIDAFPGQAVSAHVPLAEIPGLSAVSPDGSHLAYVTPSGALAMRGLGDQGACLVRSSTEGHHTLAGFGADGTLYFESEEGRADGRTLERVAAYDPNRVAFHWLAGEQFSSRLRAVPLRAAEAEDGSRVPWAVTAHDGFFGVQQGDDPQSLGLDPGRLSFLPRLTHDDSVWLLEASDEDEQYAGPRTRLALKKVRADADSDRTDLLDFDARESAPAYVDDAGEYQTFDESFTSKYQICVSATRPGGWRAACSDSDDPVAFLHAGPEQPDG